ncbi:MAG: DUF3021 domain-containing protein [Ruminococcus sp.]|nr:DUF3021 domain-containing protein [Ruminococcus sp.]
MKKFLIAYIQFFAFISGVLTLICAVYMMLRMQPLPENILWQISMIGAVTALTSAIYMMIEFKSVKTILLGMTVNFLLIFGVSLYLALHFGWFTLSLLSASMTFTICLSVYMLIAILQLNSENNRIDNMNDALKKRFGDDKTNDKSND